MDGFEVLKRLKQEPETQSISVVILTAYDTREYREKCQTLVPNGTNPCFFWQDVSVR